MSIGRSIDSKLERLSPVTLLKFLTQFVPERRNTYRQYFYVSALVIVALMARLLIAPLDGGIQYVTFFPAVAISAVIGGLWPGLFCATIGVVLATYLFWTPYQALVFEFHNHMVVSNVVFMIDALLVCSAIEAMHRYYFRYVEMERKLRLAAGVFEFSDEGIMVTDKDKTIVSVNPAFTTITGYSATEALGQTPRLLRSDRHGEDFYQTIWREIHQKDFWQGEIWNRRKSGELYLQWVTINRIADNAGDTENYIAVFHDITELRRKDEHIRHLAYHDTLTGLPNRLLFNDRLKHAIERANRDGSRLLLAFIDLDLFKEVNDNLGHDVGDLLLREVARRLKSHLRDADTAARLGGDEFVILLENLHDVSNMGNLASAIITDIHRPMDLDGNHVQVGASMGLACFPEDGTSILELMKHADFAMYAAKQAGRNTHRFFDKGMMNNS